MVKADGLHARQLQLVTEGTPRRTSAWSRSTPEHREKIGDDQDRQHGWPSQRHGQAHRPPWNFPRGEDPQEILPENKHKFVPMNVEAIKAGMAAV
jgi:hypothetical protein